MSEAAAASLPPNDLGLINAAFSGDLAAVESLLTRGANINARADIYYNMGSHNQVTPLMCAAAEGHLKIVQLLLEKHADVSAVTILTKSQGGSGTQAIHFASRQGHESIVTALLDAGADINAPGKFQRTPLTEALREGKLRCAKLLLARGALANIQSKKKDYLTPLLALTAAIADTSTMVSRNGKLVLAAQDLWHRKEEIFEIVQLLLNGGADPNATNDLGDPPLATLARRIPDDVRLPIARMLLKSGANADAADKHGDSNLLSAAYYRAFHLGKLLLEHPVEINRITRRGTVLDVVEADLKSLEKDSQDPRIIARGGVSPEELQNARDFFDLIKSRGGTRKADLADAAAQKPEPAKPRHIASDFLDMANDGEAEWSLLAVKAPFKAVSDAYMKLTKSKNRASNVPIKPAADGQEIAHAAAVIKVKESDWTIILYTIYYVRAQHIKHVASAAKSLSETLGTSALSYVGTEETDNARCELFVNGQKTTTAGNAKSIALLTTQHIQLPACYPTKNAAGTWLAVEASSKDKVERADLIS